jgi:tRNA pseudouridine32 synthase/23S rRNA pseudouridine746 synthase
VHVAATVGVTATAGVAFAALRERSGSLLAPIGLHWAINGIGLVTAALIRSADPDLSPA